jgi:TonB-linked SusC/RagA family outer membrane protein
MHFKALCKSPLWVGLFTKKLKVMKITAFFLLVGTLHVSAGVYAQKVTITEKNAPLEKVFKDIREQTGYTFVYTESLLKKAKVVSLDIRSGSIEEALDLCFHDQPFSYEIIDKTIVIKPIVMQGTETVLAVSPPPIDIVGTVSDPEGRTLAGVSITVKGSKTGTESDANGVFRLKAIDESSVLIFSYVGYEKQQVTVGNKTSFNIVLKLVSSTLNDVVVIGYGTQRRMDVNGAISSISSKDIADIPQAAVDQMMQGKAAGVTVTQNSGTPGSATSVHIRGITSFGNSEPLYVIDGIAVSGDASNSSTSGQPVQLTRSGGGQEETGVSPLAMINPNDIESIIILKDASASAIYGSRAANGVVLITTKKGRNGSAHIEYDGFYGVQQQGKFLNMMNLPQYASLENSLADAFGITRRPEFANQNLLGPGTNWQDAIFQNAPETNNQLSFSGGSNGVDYYVSGGYFNQDGTVIGSNFNRYSVRSNVNAQVKDWFKLGAVIGSSRSNQNVGLGDNTGVIYNALLSAPDIPIYNADGTFAGPSLSPGGLAQGTINPVAQALSITNTLLRTNVNGSLYGEIKFLKDFVLRSEVNGDFNWGNAATFNPTYTWGAFSNQTATLNEYNSNSTYWDWKEFLNYNHTFGGKHNVTALAGHEVWESTWGGVNNTISNFPAGNSIQTLNMGDQTTGKVTENKGSTVMESWLARGIYTYDNKYSLTATFRQDQTSKFAPGTGNQVGNFPSAAVSWRLSEEPFMAGIKHVADNLKIRFGYGTTGNQNVPNYLYGSALTPVSTGLGTGFIVTNVANPNIKWETAIQNDVGLDFSLWNGVISGSADYYNKTSKNFLFQNILPAFLIGGVAEYSSAAVIAPPYFNTGEIQNKGVEFTINTKNITHKNFTWTSGFIFSMYKNIVVSLNNVPALIGSVNSSFISLPVTKTVAGGPVGEFYGYKVQGIIKTDAQLKYLAAHPQNVTGGNTPATVTNDKSIANSIWLGDIQYEDVNNDGKVDANDQVPLGNPNPTFIYSISNTFTYKAFDLFIFLNGSYGGKILNALDYQIAGLSGLYQNQLASTANFWSPANPNSDIPAPKAGVANSNLVMSDRFLESASFLRIQNVRFGYTLPDALTRKIKINQLKVYVSAQNLYVFTKYSGLDPEIGSLNQNPILMNVDMGRYPSPRVITFGINLQF